MSDIEIQNNENLRVIKTIREKDYCGQQSGIQEKAVARGKWNPFF